MARNSLLCADVPLRNYSLTHFVLNNVERPAVSLRQTSISFSHGGGMNSLSVSINLTPHTHVQYMLNRLVINQPIIRSPTFVRHGDVMLWLGRWSWG